MKRALLSIFGLILSLCVLSAIGYTSAYVQTQNDVALAALEEEEGGITKGNFDDEGPGALRQGAPYATYSKASDMQLSLPSMSPLSDTASKLIYSLMDVIFLRFKQQLFISSVTQWKEELLHSDIQYLFPNLSRLLTSVDSENFLSSYDLWKNAIERDLQETPLGVLTFSLKVLQSNPTVTDEERSLLTEMTNLMNDIYAFRSVSNLDEFILVSTTDQAQHSQFFKLIGLVAKNSLDEAGEFATFDIAEKIKDPVWMYYYLQNIKKDVDEVTINSDEFRVTAVNISYYLDSCKTVNDFFDDLEEKPGVETRATRTSTDYMKLYLTTCDKLLIQWSNMVTSVHHNWDSYYDLYTQYRFLIVDITQQVDDKDYQGLLNTMITTSSNIAGEHNIIPVSYSRFLNLISTIALRGDADEINYREVMNSILEPVGSYYYKRQSALTVAINAYPGLGGGAETLDADFADAKAAGGLACPVGLELNWGQSVLGINGLFFSAFDLGAIATYRFSKSTTDDSNSPQVGWKQLVSPGLYLLLQNKNNPISVGLGMQMTAALRQVTDAGVKTNKNALRLGAFVSMDIPLFTFYVKHNWLRSAKG